MNDLLLVKIGGGIIDDPGRLAAFLQDFSRLQGSRMLVHGGGKIATDIGDRLGLKSKYIDGRRVTDDETLQLVVMVYGGLINKDIVARLQAAGCNAIGLTGADGNVIAADRRPVKEVDYGHVGDVISAGVHTGLLQLLLGQGLVPVLAPLTHDGKGGMLNTNADTIAQEVARALADIYAVRLVYCFEKKGVLHDPEDGASVIREIRMQDFERLKAEGTIHSGMIPKLDNAFSAIRAGVKEVIIGQAEDLHGLISGQAGTKIL